MSRRMVIITLVALAAAAIAAAFMYANHDLEETRRVMLASPHVCPPGTAEKVERAGEIGWLRSCIKGNVRHGPFSYWKKQRKHAEGAYADGRHAGPVSYFDETGKVERVEANPR